MIMKLSPDEQTFFARAAIHMADGMDMESAMRAVLDDDFRVARAFGTFRPALQRRTIEQQELVTHFAAQVYAAIRSTP
jgi:hypothetical protein